ncbi:phage tail assembly chaperone [Sphingobium sp. WCS2017Hpa-17]|uniref:phage tail assembly chaperone n=1 Tax=Sphingobium sp. WCS2017Hpa-17 TaxID=3073638 RepID=UPI002889C22E|nr:phage tail assembly chaperone [Sphingobium sp. WCS2017Hpa-17]
MTRFADAAGRLAGVAGWLLGWRPDEFWRATPAELAAVLRAARGDEGAGEGVDGAELGRLMEVMPDHPSVRTEHG